MLCKVDIRYSKATFTHDIRYSKATFIIMEIENCQRSFTKIVNGMGSLNYNKRLEKLHLTTLLERRLRGDLIETYKIINNHVNYGSQLFNTCNTHCYDTLSYAKLELHLTFSM